MHVIRDSSALLSIVINLKFFLFHVLQYFLNLQNCKCLYSFVAFYSFVGFQKYYETFFFVISMKHCEKEDVNASDQLLELEFSCEHLGSFFFRIKVID